MFVDDDDNYEPRFDVGSSSSDDEAPPFDDTLLVRRSKVQVARQRTRASQRVTAQRVGRGSKLVRSCLHVGWRSFALNVLVWSGALTAAMFSALALGHALEEFKDRDLDPTLVFATLAVVIGVFTVCTYAIYLAEAFGVDLRGDARVDGGDGVARGANRNRYLALLQSIVRFDEIELSVAALRRTAPKLGMSITGLHAVAKAHAKTNGQRRGREPLERSPRKQRVRTKRGRRELRDAPDDGARRGLEFKTVTRSRALDYDRFEDQTVQSLDVLAERESAVVQVLYSEFIYTRDAETQTSLELQRRRFKRDCSRSGECARFDFTESWAIPGFASAPQLAVGARGPCFFTVPMYTLFTLLGLSAVYRLLFELGCSHVFVDVVKRVEINPPAELVAAAAVAISTVAAKSDTMERARVEGSSSGGTRIE